MSLIKTITPVLKVLTYINIITSITTHPIRLAAILTIMSVLTFKTAVTLYRFLFTLQIMHENIENTQNLFLKMVSRVDF